MPVTIITIICCSATLRRQLSNNNIGAKPLPINAQAKVAKENTLGGAKMLMSKAKSEINSSCVEELKLS
jgi:hypothetical protein